MSTIETATADSAVYWSNLATAYQLVGSPLRPSTEDLALMSESIAAWAARQSLARTNALILGVTPGIAEMRWPAGAFVTGVDSADPMIKGVWPGDIPGRRVARYGSWMELSEPAGSVDIVVGDGSLNCLRYPHGIDVVAQAVRRVLQPNGLFVIRCYVQPDIQECPSTVFADARNTASFHHFKFRLLMSMQPSAQSGINVGDVYRRWSREPLDCATLRHQPGWEQSAIDTMEWYRDKDTVHTFPTLKEWRDVLSPYFDELTCQAPSYELGERCPVLSLVPKL